MSSQLHQQTARANGALSNGPMTDEGKAKAARNALRHGLWASRFVIDDPADQARFDRLVTDLRMTLQTVDEAQERAVEQMAIAMWRQTTVANMERALLAAIAAGEACAEAGGEAGQESEEIARFLGLKPGWGGNPIRTRAGRRPNPPAQTDELGA